MKRDALIEILKSEFDRKRSRNKAYSLRSFSRDLELDPSNLSKILSYQKEIGPKLRARIADKIGLSRTDLESLSTERTQDQAYQAHTFESFQVISDWQHYAILELFKTRGFQATPQFIASRLNISVPEAKRSLLRLKRVGLLQEADGKLMTVDESSSAILSVATSKAHRDQQRQILEGAIEALEKTPIELRSQSSMTFAIDAANLDKARAVIKKFRRDLGRLLSDSENLDEVYQLSISLYPVSIPQTK